MQHYEKGIFFTNIIIFFHENYFERNYLDKTPTINLKSINLMALYFR